MSHPRYIIGTRFQRRIITIKFGIPFWIGTGVRKETDCPCQKRWGIHIPKCSVPIASWIPKSVHTIERCHVKLWSCASQTVLLGLYNAKDPEQTLGYIIHHFNINKISWSLRTFPNYMYDQVYYSTYIDTTQYTSLQRYYQDSFKMPLIKNS